jgi:hypothetical protein
MIFISDGQVLVSDYAIQLRVHRGVRNACSARPFSLMNFLGDFGEVMRRYSLLSPKLKLEIPRPKLKSSKIRRTPLLDKHETDHS